jgi:hypothetical protein
MKKSFLFALFCLLNLFLVTSSCGQTNQPLTKEKLIGTWKVKNDTKGEVAYYNFYQGGNFFSYGKDWENRNENWLLGYDSVLYFLPGSFKESSDIGRIMEHAALNRYTVQKSRGQSATLPSYAKEVKTTYFDGKTFKYQLVGDRYTAQKISNTPRKPEDKLSFEATANAPATTPPTPTVTLNNMVGTWKGENKTAGIHFTFWMFSDQRCFVINDGAEAGMWQRFSIQNGKIYYYTIDDVAKSNLRYIVNIRSFDGKKLVYSIDTRNFVAEKINNTPKTEAELLQGSYGIENPSSSNGRAFMCGSCANTGVETCGACHGAGNAGIQTGMGYCSSLACGSGKRKCTLCKQRGLESHEVAAALTYKTPNPSQIIGKWTAQGGDVYVFTNQKAPQTYCDRDTYLMTCVSDGLKLSGTWTIEENVLKLRFSSFAPYDADQYSKYRFLLANSSKMGLQELSSNKRLILNK